MKLEIEVAFDNENIAKFEIDELGNIELFIKESVGKQKICRFLKNASNIIEESTFEIAN